MQTLINIVVLSSIYALITCGYVLVYRVSRVMNLAHGELMMLCSYLLLQVTTINANPIFSLLFAGFLSLCVGAAIYFMLMRRMTGEAVLSALLMTIALGVLLRGGANLLWGAQTQHLGFANPSLPFFGGRITLMGALMFGMVFIVYSSLFVFLKFSKWGIQMRAAGQNPLLAAQRGINLHAVYALAWGLSTFTGAIAGMLLAMNSGLDGTMVLIGLKAFPAALVGGLDSLLGALVGSAIIAIAEVYTIKFNPLLAEVMPFIILILMLVVRPWGLFGTKEELNRV